MNWRTRCVRSREKEKKNWRVRGINLNISLEENLENGKLLFPIYLVAFSTPCTHLWTSTRRSLQAVVLTEGTSVSVAVDAHRHTASRRQKRGVKITLMEREDSRMYEKPDRVLFCHASGNAFSSYARCWFTHSPRTPQRRHLSRLAGLIACF